MSLVLISVKRPKQQQGHSVAGRNKSIKKKWNPPQSQIETATYQIVKQSVNQQHHCVTLSQTNCHVFILIQFTSTHTASNLNLQILDNKTLNQELKQKKQHITSNVTSYTLCQTLYSKNMLWFLSSSLCLLLLELTDSCCFTLQFFPSVSWILHIVQAGSTSKQTVNDLNTRTVTATSKVFTLGSSQCAKGYGHGNYLHGQQQLTFL